MSYQTSFEPRTLGRTRVTSRRRFLRAFAAGGLALAAVGLDRAGHAADKPRRFDVAIHRRKVAPAQRVLRVTQGDTVEIVWTTDEATTVHLHGYNIEAKVRPGAPASLIVKARAAGRFPISAHGFGHAPGAAHGETTLLYLEIHPR